MIHSLPEKHNAEGRAYCGPTVLMFLTGMSLKEIRASINRVRLKRGDDTIRWIYNKRGDGHKKVKRKTTSMVKGMYSSEITAMLKKLRIPYKQVSRPKYKTLRAMANDMEHVKQPVIVNTTDHYVLLYHGMIYDTYRKRGCSFQEHPCAGRKIQSYWLINRR